MKTNKFLSLLLTVAMLLSVVSVPAFASTSDTLTAYVNVSQNGQIVNDKSGSAMSMASVELTGKNAYTLDDIFAAMHDTYYEGGKEAGYATSLSEEYGLGITKFWGDTSGNFGYQVNGGTASVMNASHPIQNGDVVDVVIYQNNFLNLESYTAFDEYTKSTYVGMPVTLTLNEAGYDENWNMVFSGCKAATITINNTATEYTTDAHGKVTLTFDTAGEYTVSATKTQTVGEQTTTAITAPVCVVSVKNFDASISVPSDATLFTGMRGSTHFIPFSEIKPVYTASADTITTYYYDLTGTTTYLNYYNYRISGENYITYAGLFKKGANISVTAEQLQPGGKTKSTVDRSATANSGYNVGDIYLNINPQGYLTLDRDETFQIVSLRNWEILNSATGNYFIEPDFHYEVIDENGNPSNVVEIDKNGTVTAKNDGTAIVLVTYDAITINFGSADDFYSAIYPENAGVFVVTVGGEDSGISANMTINEGKNTEANKLSADAIDAEHDCIYYTGTTGSYTFTPSTENVTVSVANPTVTAKTTYSGFKSVAKNTDNSFTVPLTTGRNIVKLEKDGKCTYQVITAKKLTVTINNGEAVQRGDTLTIKFDKAFAPVNKLAGVYNMYTAILYSNISGYDGKLAGSPSTQFVFQNNDTAQTVSTFLTEKDLWGANIYINGDSLTIPADYPYDAFILSDGVLYSSGFGDPAGNHRKITYETGKGANLGAAAPVAYLGRLPDIEIPITLTTSPLAEISVNSDCKTSYFTGDKFDRASLVVTAHYEDDTKQLATNYTVTPEILTPDTEAVTITYRGKSIQIPVTVANPKISSIEITTAPSKTTYYEGDVFNPSGLTISAVYENGVKKQTNDYTYSPNRELTVSDTEMQISYTGENATADILPVSQAITVSKRASSSTSSDNITVYFTLFGDSKHGAPHSESDTHTKKNDNLTEWIGETKLTLKSGSLVIDAVEKALALKGIPFTNVGNYISTIDGLSEMDNGPLSGWMYMLNNKYSLNGVDEQVLSNGDRVLFHYTDDYTVEKTGFSSPSTGGGGSSASTPKPSPTPTPTPTPTPAPSTSPSYTDTTYNDVQPDSWYYDAVKYGYESGLMKGTGDSFEPDASMTRAMLATVLWRMAGSPVVNYALTFDDVAEDAWYAEAVRWAASEKITSGISNTAFGSDDEITREQLAAMLYRYIQKNQLDTGKSSELDTYADSDSISEYALSALKWAVGFGIIKGNTDNVLCPSDFATRAEVATMLMRFCEEISK